MKASLTSRERVLRAMERRDHDRIPRYETCWWETQERWMKEGLNARTREEARAEILALLEADLHQIVWYWPHPFPGRRQILSEDAETRVTINESGTIERFWKNKSGTPEHIGWDCDSREKWEKVYKPAYLEQPVWIDIPAVRTRWEEGCRRGLWTFIASVEGFEILRKIMGDEACMYSFIDDPEWVIDIAETGATVLLRNLQAVLDAGIRPDGLWIYGDMAFKNMTFCSPDAYRELIWPQHKRLADWAHAHGMKFIFHSDGDLRRVMDLYIDAGFDVLQPMESKASMDIRELAPLYGNRLSFFGNIDVMKMITEDLDLIEEEIRTKFAAGMAHRGYLYHSDHSVPPQVSLKTYLHIIDLIQRYGAY